MPVVHALCQIGEKEFCKKGCNKAPFLSSLDLASIEEVACGLVNEATICDRAFAFVLCLMAWSGHRYENISSLSTSELEKLLNGQEAVLWKDKVGVQKTLFLGKGCYISHNWMHPDVSSTIPSEPKRDCLIPSPSKNYDQWLNYPLTTQGASTWLQRIWTLTAREGCGGRINSFRRSFTKDASTSGLTDSQIQRVLRWKTPTMVAHYSDVGGIDNDLRERLGDSRRAE